MVFGIRQVEFEALECQTGSCGDSSTVIAAAVAFADFHILATAEVITSGEIDVLTDEHIKTHGDMLDEVRIPAIEAR